MDEILIAARDIREGMLVDFEALYRDFGQEPPDWSVYEYGEVIEVVAEDVVMIGAIGESFALARDHAVVVVGPVPPGYIVINQNRNGNVYGLLD